MSWMTNTIRTRRPGKAVVCAMDFPPANTAKRTCLGSPLYGACWASNGGRGCAIFASKPQQTITMVERLARSKAALATETEGRTHFDGMAGTIFLSK